MVPRNRIAAMIVFSALLCAGQEAQQKPTDTQQKPGNTTAAPGKQKPGEITIQVIDPDKENTKQRVAQPTVVMSIHPITTGTRMTLIRGLEAEFVFLKRTFPMGTKGLTLKDGVLSPDDATLRHLAEVHGAAGRPGDRAQITAVDIRGNAIYFELNGGSRKKKKWYQHIEVGVGGTSTPVGGSDNPMAKGSSVLLEFDKFVPDLTVEQVKELLAPLFEFSGRSAVESFTATLPPKVQDAIKNHQVLVGMNKELVVDSKGRPEQRIRESGEEGKQYEEWVYGTPPQEVTFVRFDGDEVTQVKLMTVDGQRMVHTEKEMDMKDLHAGGQTAAGSEGDANSAKASDASGAANPQPDAANKDAANKDAANKDAANKDAANKDAAAKRPSLRRPGEAAPDADDSGATEQRNAMCPGSQGPDPEHPDRVSVPCPQMPRPRQPGTSTGQPPLQQPGTPPL